MKKRTYALIFTLTAILCSCIKNDVPYPHIMGDVLAIAFEGQSSCEIDHSKREINLVMNDSYDVNSVKITALTLVDGGVATISAGNEYNLSSDFSFTVSTYPEQNYTWTIKTTQPIERYVTVDNQVGNAVIDTYNKKAIVYVSASQSLANINVREMRLGPSVATYSPDPTTVKDFTTERMFDVSYLGITERWVVYIFHTTTVVTTGTATPWTTFATLTGSIQTGTSSVPGFDYRKKTDTTWSSVPTTSVTAVGGAITAKLTGLTAKTEYVFRAKLGADLGEEVSFTTDDAPTIQNLDFEAGSFSSNGKTWYPNNDNANSFWATGNEGTQVAGKGNISISTTDAVKGNAVKMTSVTGVLVAQHAAGNIYTGTYKTNLSKPRESAVMGRPYTGRPLGLKGWYKYTSANITVDKDNLHPDAIGTRDKAHIYVILENWGTATTRPADVEQIAYGEFMTDVDSDTYQQFSLELKYSNTTTRPTHITISCTSSYLGGDFCGSNGATLYVDEFELLF
ncbi:MAG: PCMD domain-containing protein [Flavobacteriales bacterium]|nr:PCMD domain-containing protein [Flavobacteriales bacterium]